MFSLPLSLKKKKKKKSRHKILSDFFTSKNYHANLLLFKVINVNNCVIGSLLLNHPCMFGINTTWLNFVILLTWFCVLFPNLFAQGCSITCILNLSEVLSCVCVSVCVHMLSFLAFAIKVILTSNLEICPTKVTRDQVDFLLTSLLLLSD